MLKQITREDHIKRIIPIVPHGGTRPYGDLHILGRIFFDSRKKIKGMFLQALDVIDKMAVAGPDFKNLGLRADVVFLEETADFPPHAVSFWVVHEQRLMIGIQSFLHVDRGRTKKSVFSTLCQPSVEAVGGTLSATITLAPVEAKALMTCDRTSGATAQKEEESV